MTSDIAGPSPRNMSTAQATSSTSITNSKPKRPVVPTTTGSSSMPRPLHLALGSVVSSSSSPSTPSSLSPCPSPGPSRTDQHLSVNGNSPSDGVGDGAGLAGSSSANTPNTSRAPSPSPLSPAITGFKRHSASSKRSSISYIPSNGPSPSQGQFAQQRSSMDGPGFARSPLSSTHPPTSFFGVGDEAGRMSGAGAGLSRSNSLGSRGPRTPKSLTFNEKSTSGASSISGTGATQLGSKDMNGSNQMPAHLKERPPITLAEKHAELLHFIAQKESKCLELRSQLAVHEAELLQLKRKWERIVNRGFERSMSASGTANPSAPVPLSASLLSTSPTSPSSLHNNAGPSPSSYFPSLAPAGVVPGAVVLEGIKGGVQGMSRLIAAGIESIVLVNGPSTPSSATPSSHANDVSSASNKSVHPRTDTVPVSKHWDTVNARVHGHGQKESQSSSSTTTSAASSSTFSSLSSASSATSASSSTKASISGSSSTSGNTTKKSAASSSSSTSTSGTDKDTDADADSEFGDFEEGRARLSLEQEQDQDQEQVLMVDDTGATPTMSPNPHFRRRKEAVEHIHVEKLVLSPPDSHTDTRDSELSATSAKKSSSTQEEDHEEFDWDDGWGEPVVKAKAKAQDRDRDRDMGAGASDTASLNDVSSAGAGSGVQTKSGGPTSLPLSPTIPGLGALNMNMGAPTTQQMSSWVGSMGKRWDDLKGSTTFTKSQKRASLLLSDMQNTIVSALISPPPPSSSNSNTSAFSPPNQQTSTSKPTLSSFSSNASHSSSRSRSPNLTASPSPLSTKPTTSRSTTSLLDDSDDEHENENLNAPSNLRSSSSTTISKSPRIVVPVMVPDSLSPSSSQAQSQSGLKKSKAATAKGASPVANLKVVDDDEWNW